MENNDTSDALVYPLAEKADYGRLELHQKQMITDYVLSQYDIEAPQVFFDGAVYGG